MKRIAILGSTGSIGQSALSVVDAHADRLKIVGMAAGENVERLVEQVERYRPRAVAMASEAAAEGLKSALTRNACEAIRFFGSGTDGLRRIATEPDVDIVLCASSGTAALGAVLAAIEAGKTIALANKEVLVMAGALVMEAARHAGVHVLPVDSEHNAIHQCLQGRDRSELRRLILTASGGPFRGQPSASLAGVSPEEALRHPTWNMGPKITIDSATLMNKGLEVIEAHWLFGVPAQAIDVVIHPQSIVHSMIELRDGSIIAQLGITDMRVPIQYAFSYPERWDSLLPSLDLTRSVHLEFELPDHDRFPCLGLAYRALRAERSSPVVLNAANEVAVTAFLDGRLPFTWIPKVIEQALDASERAGPRTATTLADVKAIDGWARQFSEMAVKAVR